MSLKWFQISETALEKQYWVSLTAQLIMIENIKWIKFKDTKADHDGCPGATRITFLVFGVSIHMFYVCPLLIFLGPLIGPQHNFSGLLSCWCRVCYQWALPSVVFYLLVEMGLPLHLLPAYMLWDLHQLCIKRHHYKDLKWTKFCLGPIHTCLEAFLGFLGKTKIKAYTKLTDCW